MSSFIYNLTDTWNSVGTTFTAIKMAVTDTASAAGSKVLDLLVGGASVFSVAKNGDVSANTLATAGAVAAGSNLTCNQYMLLNNPAYGIQYVGRLTLRAPADGQMTLFNNAETNFDRLNFGGTTSSFPALKRSGTQIQARLADDSGVATLVFKLPTADPAMAGALWNNAGTITISAG